jgi:hypothetical protein
MKIYYLALIAILSSCNTGDPAYREKISVYQQQLSSEFSNPLTSPLDAADLKHFKGLKFYPPDETYKVKATFARIENAPVFELPHSHERTKPYRNYGKVRFTLNGQAFELLVLEAVKKKEGYDDYLLIPFTDLTNGRETYGGGRYLDFTVPKSTQVELDFNLAYNPYCAYSSHYTCPIPPAENHMNTEVRAGVRFGSAEEAP